MLAAGMEPPPAMDPARVGDFIQKDLDRWQQFVGAVGLEKLSEPAKQ
jgi:hypothetical protein